jgi:protein CpxP
MHEQSPTQVITTAPNRRPFLKGILAGGLIASLLAGGAAAFANGEHHSHFWKAGGCRHGNAMRDPAVMKERADFMADRMLDRVKATDEQRARVKATLQASLDEMLRLRADHLANRAAMMAALTQPTVDRAELERIRSAEIQLAERASTTLVSSMADIAEALDPEQRKAIAEMAARWSGHGREL